MAERIPPGFSIPLGFYDGPEVRSIPKRIRAHAIGVFALAGNYSATKLSDGYVDNATLATFGCSDGVREALKNTLGREGLPDPIWVEAPHGILFAKWPKWQRTNAEVTTHREAEAARKREARARRKREAAAGLFEVDPNSIANTLEVDPKRTANTLSDESLGPAVTSPRPPGRLPESGQSETEAETEYYYRESPLADTERKQEAPVREERGQERGRSDPVHHSAARLVSTLVPAGFPAAFKTSLRLQASALIVGDQMAPEVVAESIRRLLAKPGQGAGLLPHIAADVLREGTAPSPKSKLRDWAEFADSIPEDQQHQQPSRKAIEQ